MKRVVVALAESLAIALGTSLGLTLGVGALYLLSLLYGPLP